MSSRGGAATVEEAEGHLGFTAGFAQAEDLAVGDALADVVNGEASHGADLLQRAFVEPSSGLTRTSKAWSGGGAVAGAVSPPGLPEH
jgi:hypothetical protein